MAFRLKNGRVMSQTEIVIILVPFCLQSALVYFNDIILISKYIVDHTGRVWRVVQLLYEADMTVKLKNCKLFARTIEYLGHVILIGCFYLAKCGMCAVAKLK